MQIGMNSNGEMFFSQMRQEFNCESQVDVIECTEDLGSKMLNEILLKSLALVEVLLWCGCGISSDGCMELVKVNLRMNADRYISYIIKEYVVPYVGCFECERFVFMHDNVRAYAPGTVH
jgi:hypothetical protein